MASISPILNTDSKNTFPGTAASAMHSQTLPAPKTLINFTFLVVAFCVLAFAVMLRMTPYTGFNLIPATDSEDGYNSLVVSRTDEWVVKAGLAVGDRVNAIESDQSSLRLEAKHVLRSTFEAREHYSTRQERLTELAKVYDLLNKPTITLVLDGGKRIDLDMNVDRPLSSIQSKVWLQYSFGLLAWFIGALVWSFQPTRRETLYLMLSGLGLFFVSFPGAISLYNIEMFYPNPFLLWFMTVAIGIGDFLFIGFGACVLLYFPQQLPAANRWSRWLLGGLFLYAIVTLLNNWQPDLGVTQQFLYFTYNETYLPMPFFYGVTLYLCFRQVQASNTKPVERAQALWMTLAWTLGPSIFTFLYLIPVVIGNEPAKVYDLLNKPTITLVLDGGKRIDLDMNVDRPLSSIQSKVWLQYSFGLLAWFIGALVWSFQPTRRETLYLMLSGLGLFFVSFPGAISLYNIEMFYPNPFLLWFMTVAIGIGDFLFIGFGACVLLYFPQQLPAANRWSRWLLGGLFLYAIVTLLNNWQPDLGVTQQFLYFTYNETYLPMPFFYGVTLYLCFRQVQASNTKPVERAQALWMTLAWTLGPSIFTFLYLIPVVIGNEPIVGQTWTTLALLSSYWMVLIGVARLQMFQLEKHIGIAYQWTFVSILFFGLDFILVTATQIGPKVSTIIVIASVLWIYLPIRQWFYNRLSKSHRSHYQERFSESVAMMVEDSLKANNQADVTWQLTLKELFSPLQIKQLERGNENATTAISQRGQSLNIPANAFSPPIQLSYAENGGRLFTDQDKTLASTLAILFERLYEFRHAYFSGQTQERERIRRDLHDQIGHKLLTMIYAAPDQTQRKLAQETMEQLRELIRALKNEPVSLSHALVQLRQISEDACSNVKLTLHWHNAIDDAAASFKQLSTNQYLNILNIIRELLNNTIRHANASMLTIAMKLETDVLSIDFTDNGVGFDHHKVIAGNGLHNIKSRADEIGATVKWQASSGTHVSIDIPINY